MDWDSLMNTRGRVSKEKIYTILYFFSIWSLFKFKIFTIIYDGLHFISDAKYFTDLEIEKLKYVCFNIYIIQLYKIVYD